MLTWKLWRALHTPPPAQFAVLSKVENPFKAPRWLKVILFLIALPVIPYFIVMLLFALVFPVNSTVGGFTITGLINRLINRENERKTYDLLCMTPGGKFWVGWSLIGGYLHYLPKPNSRTSNLRMFTFLRWTNTVFWVGIGAVALVALAYSAVTIDPYYWQMFIRYAIALACWVAFIWLGLGFGIVLGGLTAIWGNSFVRSHSINLGGMVSMLFAAFVLLVTVIMTFSLFPSLADRLAMNWTVVEVLQPIIALTTYLIAQEALVRLLWQALPRRMDSTRADLVAAAGLVAEKPKVAPHIDKQPYPQSARAGA